MSYKRISDMTDEELIIHRMKEALASIRKAEKLVASMNRPLGDHAVRVVLACKARIAADFERLRAEW